MTDEATPSHGGRRPGAGRPSGSGTYGEPTVALRVPQSWVPRLQVALASSRQLLPAGALRPASEPRALSLPLFACRVPAGFPSPAEGYVERQLDLNDYLVEHEAATFYLRVKGHSMTGDGILDGDIVAVERSLEPRNGDIVLAVVDSEFTVKTLALEGERVRLLPSHPFHPDRDLVMWGVVSGVVRKLR